MKQLPEPNYYHYGKEYNVSLLAEHVAKLFSFPEFFYNGPPGELSAKWPGCTVLQMWKLFVKLYQ